MLIVSSAPNDAASATQRSPAASRSRRACRNLDGNGSASAAPAAISSPTRHSHSPPHSVASSSSAGAPIAPASVVSNSSAACASS